MCISSTTLSLLDNTENLVEFYIAIAFILRLPFLTGTVVTTATVKWLSYNMKTFFTEANLIKCHEPS